MVSELERSHVRQLVQSPQWVTIKSVRDALVAKITQEQTIGDTEWLTIRQTLERSGRIRGVQELVETLEGLSSYEPQ